MKQENPELKEGAFVGLILRLSDLSVLAKWPLLVLAVLCWFGSGVVWYAKADWQGGLNKQDLAFLGSFLRFTKTLLVVLKPALVICFVIFLFSLVVFLLRFLKMRGSEEVTDSAKGLLSNSFFFGLSLIFIVLAMFNERQATGQAVTATNQRNQCRENLETLGRALLLYAKHNYHHYPPPDQWCEMLAEDMEPAEELFLCPAARIGECHYALNPNAEPISRYADFDSYLESIYYEDERIREAKLGSEEWKEWSFWSGRYFSPQTLATRRELPKLVLLFETKSGWNQSGGPELLTTENHEGKGCNVLFNDGRVKFVRPEQLGELIWSIEESKK